MIAGPSSVIGVLPRAMINSLHLRKGEKKRKIRRSLEPRPRDEEIRFIHRRFLSRLPLFPLIIPLRAIVPPLPLSSALLNWLLPFWRATPIAPASRFHRGSAIRRRISAKLPRRHVPDQRALTRVANVIDNPLRHRVRVALTMLTMRPLPSISVRGKKIAVAT